MTGGASHPARWTALAWQALAAAVYLALTLLYLRPIWRLAATHIAPDPGDPVFLLDILKWGIHQARLGFPDFWNVPIFYPTRGVTALSEHLLGPALAATAWRAVDPNPIAAFNLIFAASFVACGWSVFYVLRRSGSAPLPALLGGAIFAFSPFRWDHLSHLQVLLAGLVPLVLWRWDRLLAAPSWRRAAGFVALYAVHLSGGTYLAYMIHFPLAALLVGRLASRPETPGSRALAARRLRVLLPTVALCAALFGALFWPYARVARALGLERTEHEARDFGASAVSFVTPSSRNLYSDLFPDALWRPENSLFAGFLPTALAAAALAAGIRRRRASPERPLSPARRWALAGFLLAAAAGYALGEVVTWRQHGGYELPFLLFAGGLGGWVGLRRRWGGDGPLRLAGMDPWTRGLLFSAVACLLLAHPLVYAVLMKWAPGMKGMRVPARFYVFVSFPLAYAAARGFAELRARLATPAARRVFGLLVAIGLLVELAPRALTWIPLEPERGFPPVYRWLAGRGDLRAYVELPIGQLSEAIAVYHDSAAWRPLVNGYSGYKPAPYQELQAAGCFPLPESAALDLLRRWGVTHVLLHTAALDRRWERRVVREWEAAGNGEIVYDDGGDRVYRILPSPPAPAGKIPR